MLTVLGSAKHFTRDRENVALMACYAERHGIPYHIETHNYKPGFWNKQQAMIKHLPRAEWLLYVDSDAYVTQRNLSVMDWLHKYVHNRQETHVVLSEIRYEWHPVGGFDAGILMVRSSDIGKKFLQDWVAFDCHNWQNSENGALNSLFLHWVVPSYHIDRPCDTELQETGDALCNQSLGVGSPTELTLMSR